MSLTSFVSPGTRFVESDQKATNRPSSLTDGCVALRFVAADAHNLGETSLAIVDEDVEVAVDIPGHRLLPKHEKATHRPSGLMAEPPLEELDGSFVLLTLTTSVVPSRRSRTKTRPVMLFPCCPLVVFTLTSSVVPEAPMPT
jgi:hypothetical protein